METPAYITTGKLNSDGLSACRMSLVAQCDGGAIWDVDAIEESTDIIHSGAYACNAHLSAVVSAITAHEASKGRPAKVTVAAVLS